MRKNLALVSKHEIVRSNSHSRLEARDRETEILDLVSKHETERKKFSISSWSMRLKGRSSRSRLRSWKGPFAMLWLTCRRKNWLTCGTNVVVVTNSIAPASKTWSVRSSMIEYVSMMEYVSDIWSSMISMNREIEYDQYDRLWSVRLRMRDLWTSILEETQGRCQS